MTKLELRAKLINSFSQSPQATLKCTNFFEVYVDLFGHLVDTDCTFIETGVLNGGSLFMWRSWLGPKARIIGVDLNPGAARWREHGFEIYIGDQGDPAFWESILPGIGGFDAFLDDGGHQSFQQIVTLTAAMKYAKPQSVIAIEDTLTSHMKDFADHGSHSFLEYAKDSTDILSARMADVWPGQYPAIRNLQLMQAFARIGSVEFFPGIVAYKLSALSTPLKQVWNRRLEEHASHAFDYRSEGLRSAEVVWPDPFASTTVVVEGLD